MIYVKKDFKNRNLAQERQTIPRAFVYEHSVEGEKFTYSPLTPIFFLSICAHMHACKFMCVIFILLVLAQFSQIKDKQLLINLIEIFSFMRAANYIEKQGPSFLSS